MKKVILAGAMSLAICSSYAGVKLDSEEAKLSYAIGSDLGRNFKAQSIKINPDIFLQGMKDSLSGNKRLMSDKETQKTLQAFQKQMLLKRLESYKKEASSNKQKGEKFLEQNKKNPGIVTTKSGLQYKVLKKGAGLSPKINDSVLVEYTGKLLNGKVFDSSVKTGKPATFQVNQVIAGWTEALQLMKPGGEWEIFVPSNLAYGPRGTGSPIGPNETLVFNIKLISIQKKNNS